MKNLVNELNLLKHVMDIEVTLRAATETEFANGNQNGPMRAAHDQSITNVIAAAQALVQKANLFD